METGLGKPRGLQHLFVLREPGGKGSFMASAHPECSTGVAEGPSQLEKGNSAGSEAEQGIVHPTKTGIQGMQRSFREELGLGRPQGYSLLHPRVGCAGGTP